MSEGPFVEDWEFETLMGVSRVEMKDIYENWRKPPNDEQLSVVRDALNNLLGYPHGKMPIAEEMMGATRKEMLEALASVPGRDFR